jgi:hypothetical protein
VPALLFVASVATGCHRRSTRAEPAPARSTEPVAAPVVAPKELVAEGVLRRPQRVWTRLRALFGERAAAAPSTLSLTITTVAGLSPLVAGLVESDVPVRLAALELDAAPEWIFGVAVTNGKEFLAATTNGADATFTAEPDLAHAVTLLHSKAGRADVALGVAGNVLLLSPNPDALRLGGGYVARSAAMPADGDDLELTVPRTALAGVISSSIDRFAVAERAALEAADDANRRLHGGRAPDFGDPAAVIAALSGASDEIRALLESTARVHVRAALVEPPFRARVDLEPEATGATRAFTDALASGDLSVVATLPATTEAAVVWRRSASFDPSAVLSRVRALFGDRLRDADVARIASWVTDVDRGLGMVASLGVLNDERPEGFVLSPAGDGAALCRATGALVEIGAIPAIALPFRHFVGDARLSRSRGTLPGFEGAVTELRLRWSNQSGAPSPEAVCATSRAGKGALVVASGDAGPALSALLAEPRAASLGDDAIVGEILRRSHARGVGALVVKLTDPAGALGTAALVAGVDAGSPWAELDANDVAARLLLAWCMVK